MNTKQRKYSFIQYMDGMKIPNGIYNALYNKEHSIIKFKDFEPVFVQFINNSSIYDKKGILKSSIEILLPAQTL